MISVKKFTLLCFLAQVSIGVSYAEGKDQDESMAKQPHFGIDSEENKIETEDGPFFFKINTKHKKPYKLPILESSNFGDSDQNSAWDVYNNEKTSKVKENDKDHDGDVMDGADELLEAPVITLNESTKMASKGDITISESTSKLEKPFVEPLHRGSTYIYFYTPFNPLNAPETSSASQKYNKDNTKNEEIDTKDDIEMDNSAFSSLGFGYPFVDNIFSIPSSNIKIKNLPKVHKTPQIQEYDDRFSSLGFGYPFFNNLHSLPDEKPIKRTVTKVKIFAKGFEDDQTSEPQITFHSSSDIQDEKNEGSDKPHSTFDDDIQMKKGEENKEKSANVEEILGSIMPLYNWATSSLFNMDINRDILNIGKILRNNYHSTLTADSDKKEEQSKPQYSLADILPDVEKGYDNDDPEPQSFIEEVMDEINDTSKDKREINIERPPTIKDLPHIESDGNYPKTPKSQSPAKCICGFSQGRTNSCSCFPETFVYYQYCSVPVPPTD